MDTGQSRRQQSLSRVVREVGGCFPLLLFDWALYGVSCQGGHWMTFESWLVGPDAGSSLSPATGHYFQGGPKAASHFQVQRSLLGEWSTSYNMKLILNNDTRRHGHCALGAL